MNDLELASALLEVADNDALLEVGRKAIEDVLITFRNDRISLLNRGNGLVCYEYDGTPSNVIRLGSEAALVVALRAIAAKLT